MPGTPRHSVSIDCSVEQMATEDIPVGLTVRAQRGSELDCVLSGRPHGFGVQMPRQAMTLWGEQCWGRAKERIRDDNPPRRTEGRGHVWELIVASFFQFRKWEIGTYVVPKCRGSQLRPLWPGPAHLSSLVPLLPSAPAKPASHWPCSLLLPSPGPCWSLCQEHSPISSLFPLPDNCTPGPTPDFRSQLQVSP